MKIKQSKYLILILCNNFTAYKHKIYHKSNVNLHHETMRF